MPKSNTFCKICGKKYYTCVNCNKNFFKWKNVACSVECFQKYITNQAEKKDGDNMDKAKKLNIKHPLRIKTFENDKMHDILNFNILSEKENWMKSTDKNRIFEINDVVYLYIPRLTMLDIINDIREDAIGEGYEKAKKEILENKKKIKKNIES